jgi:hypothetical protein
MHLVLVEVFFVLVGLLLVLEVDLASEGRGGRAHRVIACDAWIHVSRRVE